MNKRLLLSFLLIFSSTVFAKKVTFPKIVIENAVEYSGKKLNVFYISGRPASYGTQGYRIIANKIWNSHENLKISSSGRIEIPAAVIENKFGIAFNYVLFVIYENGQKEHQILNADGTCPALANQNLYKSRVEYCSQDNSVNRFVHEKSYASRQLKANSEGIIKLKLK